MSGFYITINSQHMAIDKNAFSNDLSDNKHDAERLKPEVTSIKIPDVEDIPGQENVHPTFDGQYGDTTITSADEEGEGLWKEEDDILEDNNISDLEENLLDNSGTAIPDDANLAGAALDVTDDDGDELNELGMVQKVSGSDLDLPNSHLNLNDEEIGEEDEENNNYSIDDNQEDKK